MNAAASNWNRVAALVATKQPKAYEEAVVVLADLRDLAARKDSADFHRRLRALRAEHVGKQAFIRRLRGAGL
jgi:hypothetical protein